MATRYTIGAGLLSNVAVWDGEAALPGDGDIVQFKHAMTNETGLTFPASGKFASVDLASTGGTNPGWTVTGTATLNADVVTGIDKLVDTSATNLTIGPDGCAVSGANWTSSAAAATPTRIMGSLNTTSSGSDGLTVATASKLIIDHDCTAHSGTAIGIRISGTGELNVGGDCIGSSTSGQGIFLAAAGGKLTAETVTGTSDTTSTGNGVYSLGTITGPAGVATVCVGSTKGTGAGIYLPQGSILGSCAGSTTGAGKGVFVGGADTATITGTLLGESGTGIGIELTWKGVLRGDILISDNPTSATVLINTGAAAVWTNAAGTGPGRILAATGNTIQFADAEEFCPTANVATKDNVANGVPCYTGGDDGEAFINAVAIANAMATAPTITAEAGSVLDTLENGVLNCNLVYVDGAEANQAIVDNVASVSGTGTGNTLAAAVNRLTQRYPAK